MANTPAIQQIARRCVLASQLAYENEVQIKAVVTGKWKVCDVSMITDDQIGSCRSISFKVKYKH